MSRGSRAYKILNSLYRSVLSHQRPPHPRRGQRSIPSKHLPVSLEPLEQRVYLNADLSGLHLVDPDLDNIRGQVVYLDFDGEKDVTYDGPVRVDGIDVPAFSAERAGLGGSESQIIDATVEALNAQFSELGVTFTDIQPENDLEYSTIYVGGDDSAFSEYGSFKGLAEKVDIGNTDYKDKAFLFSDNTLVDGMSFSDVSSALVDAVGHETSHLLGYRHIDDDHVSTFGDVAVEINVFEEIEETVDTIKEKIVEVVRDLDNNLRDEFDNSNRHPLIGLTVGYTHDVLPALGGVGKFLSAFLDLGPNVSLDVYLDLGDMLGWTQDSLDGYTTLTLVGNTSLALGVGFENVGPIPTVLFLDAPVNGDSFFLDEPDIRDTSTALLQTGFLGYSVSVEDTSDINTRFQFGLPQIQAFKSSGRLFSIDVRNDVLGSLVTQIFDSLINS